MPRRQCVTVPTLGSSPPGVSEEDEDGGEMLDAGATESENDDEGQNGGEGDGGAPGGFRAVEVDSDLLTRQRMVERTRRRGHRNEEAQEMDALLTEKARELGRLQPRLLSEVTDRAQDGVLLHEGDKFMCREEVILRIAEENEFGQHFSCTHWNRAHQTLADGRRGACGQLSRRVVVTICKQQGCPYIVRAHFSMVNESDAEECLPWEIMEYKQHTCDKGSQQAEGKRTGGRAFRCNYDARTLAHSLVPTITASEKFSKTSLQETRTALQGLVRQKLSSKTAQRARDHALALIHDETGLGASRILGIQDAFKQKGYWFRVHFADLPQMVRLTAMGMKAQHDANERKLHRNKADRTKFDMRSTSGELEEYFRKAHADGVQYVIGVSFCNPCSMGMIALDQLHRISFSDSCHGHSAVVGHITQTNVLDAGRHVVPAMTSIFSCNESTASQLLHFEALKNCHQVYSQCMWSFLQNWTASVVHAH